VVRVTPEEGFLAFSKGCALVGMAIKPESIECFFRMQTVMVLAVGRCLAGCMTHLEKPWTFTHKFLVDCIGVNFNY
jgi:hypothetical protein